GEGESFLRVRSVLSESYIIARRPHWAQFFVETESRPGPSMGWEAHTNMSQMTSTIAAEEKDSTQKAKAYPAKAYAAQSAASGLAPASIRRREPGPTDVQMEILFCGVCHSDLHQS